MAVNNKSVNTDLTLAKMVMEVVNTGRAFHSKINDLKAVQDAMVDGADVSVLATNLGMFIPGTSPPQPNTAMANDYWYLLNSAKTAFENEATLMQLISWVTPQI